MATQTSTPPVLSMEDVARFWRSMESCIDGCWMWKLGTNRSGYGKFKANGRTLIAHRVALFLTTGEWPPVAMHTCDTPQCCRPDHIRAGTHADNMADRNTKNRQATGDRNGSRVHIERMPRGIHHKHAKLTDDAVREIYEAQARGERQVDVAQRLGVSQAIVSRVMLRRAWRHVQ